MTENLLVLWRLVFLKKILLLTMLKHSVWLPEYCFQFKYLEFHSNWQTSNVGRA